MKSVNVMPALTADDDQWMTEKEVANYLKCSTSLLQKMRWRGEGLRFHKLGKRAVRYLKSDVDAYVMGGGDD